MNISSQIETFEFDYQIVKVLVPETESLQNWYKQQQETTFPFWGKVWPAAKALCIYLSNISDFFSEKKVIEIAGGLGLPSLYIANYARHVICSDYNKHAIEYVKKSIEINELTNITTAIIDWSTFNAEEKIAKKIDILLMSDINYDPEEFAVLNKLLLQFLKRGTNVILSTPQRLMAKPFIDELSLYIFDQKEFKVDGMYFSVIWLWNDTKGFY